MIRLNNYVCVTAFALAVFCVAAAAQDQTTRQEKERKAEEDLRAVLGASKRPGHLPRFSWQAPLAQIPEERRTDQVRQQLRRALWQDLQTLARIHVGTPAADEARRRAEDLVRDAWTPLRKRAGHRPENPAPLRQELLAFRHTFLGTPEATEAAEFLASLPSPLDRLDAKQISGGIPSGVCPELVAVISPDTPAALTEVGGPPRLVAAASTGTLIQFSPAGDALVVGASREVPRKEGAVLGVWDLSGDVPRPGAKSDHIPSFLKRLSIDPYGNVLYASQRRVAGGWARPFDASSPRTMWRQELSEWPRVVNFSAAGDLLVTVGKEGESKAPRWWVRIHRGAPNFDQIAGKSFSQEVTAAAISDDGLWIAVSVEKELEKPLPPSKNPLDDIGSKGEARRLAHESTIARRSASVLRMAFSPAGLGEEQFLSKGTAAHIAFAPDGRTVAVDHKLVGLAEGQRQEAAVKLPAGALYSPDGQTLAVTNGKEIQLVDAATGRQRAVLSLPEEIGQIAFAPDGRHVAAAGRKKVYVLRLGKASR